MRIPDMSTCKKCIALLAVAMLHLVMLASFRYLQPFDPVQSLSQGTRLTITLVPPKVSALLPPTIPEKRRHTVPPPRSSSSTPVPSQSNKVATTSAGQLGSFERKTREEEASRWATEKTAELAGTSSNNLLHEQPMNWKSDTGAVDRRWLPRDTGSLQSGAVRPELRARTPQELLERRLSRAAREDCRTKHAHMGLLAIPFLVTDTVNDTGCRW